MRAATIRDGKIVGAEHPDPEPGTGQVLVRVHAAGLNGADQAQLLGLYPPPTHWSRPPTPTPTSPTAARSARSSSPSNQALAGQGCAGGTPHGTFNGSPLPAPCRVRETLPPKHPQ